MSTSDHPASRILRKLEHLISVGDQLDDSDDATELWCKSEILLGGDCDFEHLLPSVREFQQTVDEWARIASTYTPDIRYGVNEVVNTLQELIYSLTSYTVEEALDVCRNVRLPVAMGIAAIAPEVEWSGEYLAEVRKSVQEWKEQIIASSLEPLYKRNIIDALDDVIEAIDSRGTGSNNRITDAIFRAQAMIQWVSPVLVRVGIPALVVSERITKMLSDGE